MSKSYFVYCSKCGFYPSNGDIAVGVESESHAVNMADLHGTKVGHETFLIPGNWMDSRSMTETIDTSV